MWKSFTAEIILTSQTRSFWVNTGFILAICHKLEKRWADFFQDYPKCHPFQSYPFMSIHASLSFCCNSFNLCGSTILKWLLQCFIFYFVGHFGCHEIASFCVTCIAPLTNGDRYGNDNLTPQSRNMTGYKRESNRAARAACTLMHFFAVVDNWREREDALWHGLIVPIQLQFYLIFWSNLFCWR